MVRDRVVRFVKARHSNKPDHSISGIECVTLKVNFSNSADSVIQELTLIPIRIADTHRPKPKLQLSYTLHTYFHK